MSDIHLQPLDPSLNRYATVNDLRSMLEEVASQGGGSLLVTVYYKDDGSTCDWEIRLSDVTIGRNEFTKATEVQIRVPPV